MKEYKDQEGGRPNLYHRVVGALVLVALAVIFVPMVLDLRKDYGRVITRTNIPEKPEEYQVKEVPLTPPAPIADTGDDSTQTSPPGPPPSSASSASSGEDRAGNRVPPATAGDGDAGRTPESGWVVQLGSFAKRDNAVSLRDRLQEKGYSAFVDRVEVEGRTVWRVAAGPVPEEARGSRLRDELERVLGLDGLVRRYGQDDAGR